MIHEYAEFVSLYDEGKVKVDYSGCAGWMKEIGLELRAFREQADFLQYCRQSQEKFEAAHTAGADFWAK